MAGKGDADRTADPEAYRRGHDRIFGGATVFEEVAPYPWPQPNEIAVMIEEAHLMYELLVGALATSTGDGTPLPDPYERHLLEHLLPVRLQERAP